MRSSNNRKLPNDSFLQKINECLYSFNTLRKLLVRDANGDFQGLMRSQQSYMGKNITKVLEKYNEKDGSAEKIARKFIKRIAQIDRSSLNADLSESLALLKTKLENLYLPFTWSHYQDHQKDIQDYGPTDFATAHGFLKNYYLVLRKDIIGPVVTTFSKTAFTQDVFLHPETETSRDDDVAYDYTLVRRKPYYDASRIELEGNLYIALHVPTRQTTGDFYKLLIEDGVHVLVNLTEPNEKSNDGLEYWPRNGKEDNRLIVSTSENKTLCVVLENEEHIFSPRTGIEFLTIRNLHVTSLDGSTPSNNKPFKLIQIHYRNWEDHSIPDQQLFMDCIVLVNKYNELQTRNITNMDINLTHDSGEWISQAPIAVHCHSGVGRTGTFVLVHALLSSIDRNKSTTCNNVNASVSSSNNNNNNNNGEKSTSSTQDSRKKSGSRIESYSNNSGVGSALNTTLSPLETYIRLRIQRESVQGEAQLAFAIHCINSRVMALNDTAKPTAIVDYTPPFRSREDEYYRLVSYLDVMGSRKTAQRKFLEREVPERILMENLAQDKVLYDKFLREEIVRVERLLEEIEDKELSCLVNRFAKMNQTVLSFLSQLLDQEIPLSHLNNFIKKKLRNSKLAGDIDDVWVRENNYKISGLQLLMIGEIEYLTECCEELEKINPLTMSRGRMKIIADDNYMNSFSPDRDPFILRRSRSHSPSNPIFTSLLRDQTIVHEAEDAPTSHNRDYLRMMRPVAKKEGRISKKEKDKGKVKKRRSFSSLDDNNINHNTNNNNNNNNNSQNNTQSKSTWTILEPSEKSKITRWFMRRGSHEDQRKLKEKG
eukprot:TRINITY_DN2189_c0_g1_i1.p1 TRINITY_DN2189_c0_g1~~TRINITY_DN2189_c0_g1_i1.p1  ORF type:complete len:822 (+),score=209.29 TRINITY_DN2189_c0_g1_i1:218-2683(+)